MQNSDSTRRLVYTGLVLLAAIPFLIPLVWIVSTSFKPSAQIFMLSPDFIPTPVTFEHYRRVFEEFAFLLYLRNSVIVTLGTVAGALFSSCSVAYALSCMKWPDRSLVFGLLMTTLFIPPQVTMIPAFLIFRYLGWVDTFLPLIVPFFLGNAFYVFLLRQFFLGLPSSLIEAARVDGAAEPKILLTIAVPLCKPAILSIVLFSGVGAWNDFMGPLIYLFSEEKKTLALGLQSLVGQYASEWGMLMAASFLMALPVLTFFVILQKYFIRGISMTGLKA